MSDSGAGKGDTRRPPLIGREEEALRWDLAFGKITCEQYDAEHTRLLRSGKIVRSGRIVEVG